MHKTQPNFTPQQVATKAKRMGIATLISENKSVYDRISASMAVKNLNAHAQKPASVNIDLQIFQDVYTGGDLFVTTVEDFISKPNPFEADKFDRLLKLAALGFQNSEDVKDAVGYAEKLHNQTAILEKVKQYKVDYPMHRFIDGDGVQEICKKYGLLLAGVDKYKADIPEKNQNDIVNFRVIKKDIREASELNRFEGRLDEWIWPKKNFGIDDWGFQIVKPRRIKTNRFFWTEEVDLNPKPTLDIAMGFGMAMMADTDTSKVAGKNLCILAPERMLITSGNMKQGHILLNDPIILQPVPCGYLIVTSWGLEAADQAILNASHN